jgi:hypothetical protein
LCSEDGLPIDPSLIEEEEDADSTDHEESDFQEPIIRKIQDMRVHEESDEDADDQQYHNDETDEEDVRSATPDDFYPVPDGMTLLEYCDDLFLLDENTNRVLDWKTQEYLGQWNSKTKSIWCD